MKTRNFTLLFIALLAIGSAQAAGLSGRDIMLKVKNRPDGDTRYATVEMTLIQRSDTNASENSSHGLWT